MENPIIVSEKKKKPYMGTFGIIKSAIKIPLTSYNFVFFTFLVSLPIFFTILLRKSFPSFFKALYNYFPSSHSNNLIHDTSLFLNFTIQYLGSLLFDFLGFLVAITTVHSASKIHTTGIRSISLRKLVAYFIATVKTRWLIVFFSTFYLMTTFSELSLHIATYWGEKGPLVRSRTRFFQVIHGITYVLALIKHYEYTTLWHVALVLSILDTNVRGMEVFWASGDLMKGNRTRGTILMLVDVGWRVSLNYLPTVIFPRWGFSRGIGYNVVDTFFRCVGLITNWVVWVVYYYDCKNRRRYLKNKETKKKNRQRRSKKSSVVKQGGGLDSEPLVDPEPSVDPKQQMTISPKKMLQLFGSTLFLL
ncbi:Transmembrane protein [Trema orientale]|uniref:Transmembrane protein n=1 Tax=Trema orientale TaxID=63057 RepID=A0A2P5FMB2_TREOI|nr:Transmembrane protein [Trema orientale]